MNPSMGGIAGGAAALLQTLNRTFALLAGLGMLAMMFVGAADVIGTNLFRKAVPAAFEFMATMMVVIVFFSLSLAQAQRAHVRVELVVNLLPLRVRLFVDVLQDVLTLVFVGLVAWFGWKAGMRSFEVGEFAAGIIPWPIYPARIALAAGASLMCCQCLHDILVGIRRLVAELGPGERPSP